MTFLQHNWFWGYAVSCLFWIASVGSTIAISINNKGGIMLLDGGTNFQDIYIKPWTRIGPYIIGMATGYCFYRFKDAKKRIPTLLVIIMWVISFVVGVSVIYGLAHYYIDDEKPTRAAEVIYLAFSRFVSWRKTEKCVYASL